MHIKLCFIFLNIKVNFYIQDCIVDENGCYTSDAGPKLKGLFVLKEGNEKVLEIIKDKVLHIEDFIHSYPYDWRTKKPVILRASEQWFLNTEHIKEKCVQLLCDVEIMPKINSEKHRKNLIGQITKRPYWCISRQRTWGVPIPVFYEKFSGKTIINEYVYFRQFLIFSIFSGIFCKKYFVLLEKLLIISAICWKSMVLIFGGHYLKKN